VKTKAVNYQAVYLWECPECGTTWQLRHRPREGAELVCAPLSEQRDVQDPAHAGPGGGCGSISVSAGRRKGLAPNVTI
jgi:hypothetical protein